MCVCVYLLGSPRECVYESVHVHTAGLSVGVCAHAEEASVKVRVSEPLWDSLHVCESLGERLWGSVCVITRVSLQVHVHA